MHYKAMGDLGYTGSLNDRIHKYLTEKYGSFYEALRDLRNGTSIFSLLSSYAVNNFDPSLVFDFEQNYYRTGGTDTTLNPAVTHTRAGQATMTDGYGAEEVTNGTFASGTTSWVANASATLSISSGKLQVTRVSSSADTAYQIITTQTGLAYEISVDVIAGTRTPHFKVYNSSITGTNLVDKVSTGNGTYVVSFVALSTSTEIELRAYGGNGTALYDNVSVKEINPLSVSIQMDGRMTFADDNTFTTVRFNRWNLDSNNNISDEIDTNSTDIGQFRTQQWASGVQDTVTGPIDSYSPGINVPFNFASRHGSTFVNGAVDGTALTANTTPTALPDLSTTDLQLGDKLMGTIGKFRVWSDDLTDTGIATASAPSTEPSLQLTFDGSSTSSFTVLDWSE